MEMVETRPVYEVAKEIRKVWGTKVNFAAKPYLQAMLQMSSPTDKYGFDDGKSVILYFLSNASTFKGEDAKRLKAELKAMIDQK
jgi:hypothetical protein